MEYRAVKFGAPVWMLNSIEDDSVSECERRCKPPYNCDDISMLVTRLPLT